MVINNTNAANAVAQQQQQAANIAHPSGIPQDQIDNIMSGIANTGDVRMNNHRKKLKQRFDIIKKLGQGTYGKVQLGLNKETGQEVAIKTIKKCKIEAEADLVRIRREVQIMSSVQHPNIIHIYEVFENREKMVLVMEFAAGGELYDYLSERKVLNEEEARRIFRQVATAVYYCHKHKICHRDLKLENILLDEKGNAKIADFGLSNVFDEQRLLQTFCGSPLYASPEIVEGTPYQGPEVDCWSLGVLLYTLVYGSMPFDGSNFKRLVKQISQGDYYEPKQPSRASSLIRAMLTVCPTKRATIEQICSHWWVNENDNISCLDLAEDLANQTPVRLDVLLSVTPTAITADQLVVPSADGKQPERIARSHSDGSIREISTATTEAEQRIMDMVAAGGEAALMPSPTRTITPAQSPVQSKRKLETTISTDNAVGFKKKEKPSSSALKLDDLIPQTVSEVNEDIPMDFKGNEQSVIENVPTSDTITPEIPPQQFEQISQICDQLLDDNSKQPIDDTKSETVRSKDLPSESSASLVKQRAETILEPSSSEVPEEPIKEEKEAAKVIKKFVNKHKTADLVNAIGQVTSKNEKTSEQQENAIKNSAIPPPPAFVRKCSLQDESALNKFNADRRKSRILETAEKFQQLNNTPATVPQPMPNVSEKSKKIVIPGVNVGSFKKEFERKATAPLASTGLTAGEKRALEDIAQAKAAALESETAALTLSNVSKDATTTPPSPSNANISQNVENSDSKSSVTSVSLEDARRSMENSIALLRQAQHESSKEVDQLCAKTADIGVNDTPNEREQKLKAARAIIGNAIQPVLRRTPIPVLLGGGGYGFEREDSGSNSNNMHFSSLPSYSRMPFIQDNDTNKKINNGNQQNIISNFKPIPFYPNPSRMYTPLPSTSLHNIPEHKILQEQQHQLLYTQTQSEPPTPSDVHQHNNPKSSNLGLSQALAAARQNIIERLNAGNMSLSSLGTSTTPQNFKTFNKIKPSKIDKHLKHFNSLSQPISKNSISQGPESHSQSHPQPQKQKQQQQLCQHLQQTFQNFKTPALSEANKNSIKQTLPNNLFNIINNNSSKNVSINKRHYHPSSKSEIPTTVIPTATNSKPFKNATVVTSSNKATTAIDANRVNNNYLNNINISNNINNNTVPNNFNNKINNNMLNANLNSTPKPFYNASTQSQKTQTNSLASLASAEADAVKTSSASITLKSATLPRRKPIGNKTEIQLEIKPRLVEQPAIRFTTEMQHPIQDLRSAPPREGPAPFSPIKTFNTRATSLEPKEHKIPMQKPPTYTRTTSNTTRSGSLSRQSTIDSETESNATSMSQATLTGSSQPIKKSPREFIIPIAVEGGGIITPREGSIEPSDSSHTAASSRSTFNRIRPSRRIGSLISDRTASSLTRDGGDDDGRFGLQRLRSSRPVKKLSQDNDEESSDDDVFEALTAEKLFSTLLQRVRAVTNRFNANNNFATSFPNSSRLLSNIRDGQSSFWNQDPFIRTQVSYTFSETIEKKHVTRSNPATGINNTPWSHSMTRDLDNDMDSIFSRSGATLPRGNKTPISSVAGSKTQADILDSPVNTGNSEEYPLDLADLDLSRLRLSKQDLETLSSITPALPKYFQEQLLAKLPPTQARKLSRTLSMQNSPHVTTVKIYKRSQSGGRHLQTMKGMSGNDLSEDVLREEDSGKETPTTTTTIGVEERDKSYRRSLSRNRNDLDGASSMNNSTVPTSASSASEMNKSRSSSVCRDDYGKTLGSYTSDISDKYRYYSPYVCKTPAKGSSSNENSSISPQKRYESISPRSSMATTSGLGLGRPPSGYLSPPPAVASNATLLAESGSSSLRRRPTQRRISRFLRPDFFDEPLTEENAYQRERNARESETQSVLREIREKSAEREELKKRKHSLPGFIGGNLEKPLNPTHSRNKSMDSSYPMKTKEEPDELKCEGKANTSTDSPADPAKTKRDQRSLSRPRDISQDIDTHELADKILKELQLLSAVKTQADQVIQQGSYKNEEQLSQRFSIPRELNDALSLVLKPLENEPSSEKVATIKKVKKIKSKEKATLEGGNDMEAKILSPEVTVKKVKKLVKKTDSNIATSNSVLTPANPPDEDIEASKRESKLKRPKSYPTKDASLSNNKTDYINKPTTIAEASPEDNLESPNGLTMNTLPRETKESRLVRPKSYPASKLTTPKGLKKIVHSGGEISTASCKPEPECPTLAIDEKICRDSKKLETKSSSLKKVDKVSKKSKLAAPTSVTPSTASSGTTGENSKESSPTTIIQAKEKSPEKKAGKGILYAIGQKFEKLRESATNKDKKSGVTSGLGACSGATAKKSSSDSSPEKIKEKSSSSLLKKKKSGDLASQKTSASKSSSIKKIPETIADPSNVAEATVKTVKQDKRSRIDAMFRTLRERSVPRSLQQKCSSDASFIKKAVSVENVPTTTEGKTSSKVFGLFKRSDKENSQRKVRSTRSTSNLDTQTRETTPSPIYQNIEFMKEQSLLNGKVNNKDECSLPDCDCKCPECYPEEAAKAAKKNTKLRLDTTKANELALKNTTLNSGNRDKRKGLMLDLVDNVNKVTAPSKMISYINGNTSLYSNLPPYPDAVKNSSNNSSSQFSSNNNNNSNLTNNNNSTSMQTSQTSGYHTSSNHEINRNTTFNPSYDNIPNYSPDSRSYHDDCASTSTFLSPTDEPELYFDNWSICSEDNYMMHATPSPTVSRLSRASQLSSPTRCESSDPNESMIDRIKRRSFYCRFNEKKPKRTSSIVGPSSVRDYYREQQAAVRARSSNKLNERGSSPDITREFFRPLKLSPVGTDLKPPVYRSSAANDYATGKTRRTISDIRAAASSPSFLSKRYGSGATASATSTDTDYISSIPSRYKSSSASSSAYDSNARSTVGATSLYYNTYNPKRRSSYTSNGILPSASKANTGVSNIDSYATMSRRSIRPYDQRTMSLLEPSTSTSTYRREARTPARDYTSSISRTSSRYRTSSASRSPTNI